MRTRLFPVLRTPAARVVIRAILVAVLTLPFYLIGQTQEPAGRPGVFTVGSCTLITGDEYRCDGDFHPDQGSLPFRAAPVLRVATFYPGGYRLTAYLQAHGKVQLPTSDDGQSRIWWRIGYGAVAALILGSVFLIRRLRRQRETVQLMS